MTGEALPRPLLEDGVVSIDPRRRALAVRLGPDARGYAKSLWVDGLRAQSRRPRSPRTVWASGGGQDQVAFGVPEARGDGLVFSFRRGDPVFWRLVSSRTLTARIAVDRESGRLISVAFRGRA